VPFAGRNLDIAGGLALANLYNRPIQTAVASALAFCLAKLPRDALVFGIRGSNGEQVGGRHGGFSQSSLQCGRHLGTMRRAILLEAFECHFSPRQFLPLSADQS
jgi:hypothetical protein